MGNRDATSWSGLADGGHRMCAGFFCCPDDWVAGGFRRARYGAVERTATAAYPAASKSLTYLRSTLDMSA